MTTKQLIIIISAWLIANAIYPLILNSLERLYQDRIDSAIKGLVRVAVAVISFSLQLCLFLIYLPSILFVLATENTIPSLYRWEWFADMQYGMHLIARFRFWKEAKIALQKCRQQRRIAKKRKKHSEMVRR